MTTPTVPDRWPHWVALSICVVGIAANGLILLSLAFAHRSSRLALGGTLNRTVLTILVICMLESIFILVYNALDLAGSFTALVGGPAANLAFQITPQELASRYVTVLSGYFLVTLLFAVNLVLALERFWVIRFARSLSRTVIVLVYSSAAVVLGLFVAAFVISSKVSCQRVGGFNMKFGRPFAMPGNPRNPVVKTLFISAMMYFPLVIVAIFVVYGLSYRHVAMLVQENFELQTKESSDDASLDSDPVKQRRGVLIRCTLMSAGCLLFYAPTIVSIFADRFNYIPPLPPSTSGTINTCPNVTDASNSWQYPVTTILPALDVLWTPFLILWVHTQHRAVFLKFIEKFWKGRQ
ncbi:hypothetical protein HDU98_001469 [Podochytrium sp. JEL0797]|nr:hypothetical protein HDU98_001469 [Podochytrium sp. JEL0797]